MNERFLPEREWLDQAKRLAVGMTDRVFHLRERRPNLVISNKRDRWTCYCQACKKGGTVMKEHVLLGGPMPVEEPDSFVVPTDLVPVLGSEYEQAVGRFLASKGMMFPYLPKLWVSVRAKRICLQDESGGWHGRDITERSTAKWLHYNKVHIVGTVGGTTILTEDLFSKFKVAYAMKHMPELGVASTLGAGCSQSAALALKNCHRIVWAYDGDAAGDDGFKSGSKRMRAFGSKQLRARPPDELDPKDMDCEAIRAMIMEVL